MLKSSSLSKTFLRILDPRIPTFCGLCWNGAITNSDKTDIERVQKCALHIILGDQYLSYADALETANLDSLDTRRENLCLKFAKKAVKDVKHSNWFKPKPQLPTRQTQDRYFKSVARTDRLMTSPICYLTKLLNENARK